MRLLIIRHGESEADLLDVHEGRADFPLTERGHKQAKAMAEYIIEITNYHEFIVVLSVGHDKLHSIFQIKFPFH